MKTNLNMVLSLLEKYNPLVKITCNESLLIDAVDFLDIRQKAFIPNTLYLGRASDFTEISRISSILNIILVADCPLNLDRMDNDLLSVVILNSSFDLGAIHKEISDYINKRQDFLQKSLELYDCLASGRGLQALADKSSELLGNPLAVWDESFTLLAFSQRGFIDEPLWNEAIEKGFIPYETVMLGKKSGVIEKVFKGDAPEIFHVSYLKNRFIGWRIEISGEIAGHITVLESCSTFEDNHLQILSLLCNLVSIELQKSRNSNYLNKIPFEYIIGDLLNGKLHNKELLNGRLKYLNLKLKENFIILVVKYLFNSVGNTPLPYVRDILEQIVSGSKCAIYDGSILMLITGVKKVPFSEDELKKLNKFFTENQMTGGMSRSFTDIIHTKDYYLQSCKAIELGERLDNRKSIYFYEDYSDYHLLDMAAMTGDIRNICNPLIPLLIEYDLINNCDLAHSLYIYLAAGNNLSLAASKFGIHRNSMDYRIKKIEEVLSVNLNDPNVTFSLYLSMKIIQFFEGKDFFEYRKKDSKAVS